MVGMGNTVVGRVEGGGKTEGDRPTSASQMETFTGTMTEKEKE